MRRNGKAYTRRDLRDPRRKSQSAEAQMLRFAFAGVASLALHVLLLAAAQRMPGSLSPVETSEPIVAHLAGRSRTDDLLKNTLPPAVEPAPRRIEPPRSAPTRMKPPQSTPRPPPPAQSEAQRRVDEHLFYPPEALARGLQGEAVVKVRFDASGEVLTVSLLGSSGHLLLDEAAVRAVYAIERLPAAAGRDLVLPVRFRIE